MGLSSKLWWVVLLVFFVVLLGIHAGPAGAMPPGGVPAPLPLPAPAGVTLLTAEPAGTVTESHSVGSNGQLSVRIELDAPPGRAGMEPHMALQYDGSTDNGLLGVGFRLDGFSSIERCHRSWAVEGLPDGVDFDETDRFCLDGKKLVQINSGVPYGGNGAEYRTEVESYARIRSYGDSGDGPDSFTVWAKDGRIYEYATVITALRAAGSTEDSDGTSGDALVFEKEPVKVAWLLTAVRDRAGNAMDYLYDRTEEGVWPVEYWPTGIKYTYRDKETPRREVTFDYEPRPDPITRCVSGVCFVTSKRLLGIRFLAPETPPHATDTAVLAWRYDITYEPDVSPDTGRSRIAAVRKCATEDSKQCLRAKEFTWWELGGAPEFSSISFGPSFQVQEQEPSFLHVLDVNGDGMDDLLYQFADGLSGTPFPIYLRLAEKDPGGEVAFGPEILVNLPGHLFAATDLRRSRPMDRDGDGTQELFAAVDPLVNDPTLYDTGQLLEAGYLIFRYDAVKQAFEPASGDGQFFFPADPANDVAQLTDADGNGKLDLFRELAPRGLGGCWLACLALANLAAHPRCTSFARAARLRTTLVLRHLLAAPPAARA